MSEAVTLEQAVETAKRELKARSRLSASGLEGLLGQTRGPDGQRRRVCDQTVLEAMDHVVRRGMARYYLPNAELWITEQGRRSLDTVEWLEAEEYVEEVASAAGGPLDSIIEMYLREAKRAHEEGLELSCAVTLGCASGVCPIRSGRWRRFPLSSVATRPSPAEG